MIHFFLRTLMLAFIIIKAFTIQSQINTEDVKYSIMSNRLLWRTHYFLETYKDSNNSFLNNKRYEKLFFKRNETEEIYLNKIDSLETDSLVFFEFSFLYRCSYEDDDTFNSTLEHYIKEWNDTTASECSCCKILSLTKRDGELYDVPNCMGEKGVIAISKFNTDELYFVSGGCIFINEEFNSVYFNMNGVNEKSIRTYIYTKFLNHFLNDGYSLCKLVKIDEDYWEFFIHKDRSRKVYSKYLLDINTGVMKLVD